MKKICFLVNNTYKSGGVQRVSAVIANALADEYEITFLSYHMNIHNKSSLYLDKNRIKEVRLHVNPVARFLNHVWEYLITNYNFFGKMSPQVMSRILFGKSIQKSIINQINEGNYDIVVGVKGKWSLLLSLIKDKLNCKNVIGWQHNCYDACFHTKGKLYNNMELCFKDNIGKLDKYLVLSTADKRIITEKWNINNIDYIPNPVSFETAERANLEAKRFLFVGRFDIKQKGLDLMLESFADFCKQNADWKLTMIGAGDADAIKSIAASLEIANRVEILPYSNNVIEVYKNASVLLLASRFEGMPMVALEAMSMGMPIVAYDKPFITDLVTDGKEGLLAKAFDTKDFADKMYGLATNQSMIESMSIASLDKAENYKINVISKKWREIYG